MRKRIGPQAILRVEGLSTGAEVMRDDFTGQAIEQAKPSRPPKSAQEYIDERSRAKAKAQRAIVDMLTPKAKLVAPKVEGKRPIGEITTKDGTRYAVQSPMPKWRRI